MASGTDEVLGKSNETHGDLLDDNSQSGHEEELAAEPERHSRSSPLRETQLEPEHAVQQRQKVISANVAYAAKLRPALDVLNRLRYDPNLDEEDHVVGYRDRHDGVQELCVSLWKSDTTDEEFIPQHRIKYFKRRSDGVVVWDRFMRLDLVFGSGLKQVCPIKSWLR